MLFALRVLTSVDCMMQGAVIVAISCVCACALSGALPKIPEGVNLSYMHEYDAQRASFRALLNLTKDLCNTQEAAEHIKMACAKYAPLLVQQEDFFAERDACIAKAARGLSRQYQGVLAFSVYSLLLSRFALLYGGMISSNWRNNSWWAYGVARLPVLEKKNCWDEALGYIIQYFDAQTMMTSWVFDLRGFCPVDIALRLHGVQSPSCLGFVPEEFLGNSLNEVVTLWLYGLSLCPLWGVAHSPGLPCIGSRWLSAEENCYMFPVIFDRGALCSHAGYVFEDIAFSNLRSMWDQALESQDVRQMLITGLILASIAVALPHAVGALDALRKSMPSRTFLTNRSVLSALHEHMDVENVVERIGQKNMELTPAHVPKYVEECLAQKHLCRKRHYDVLIGGYIDQSPEWQKCFCGIDRAVCDTLSLQGVARKFNTVFINLMGCFLDCQTEKTLLKAYMFCTRLCEDVRVVLLSKSVAPSETLKQFLSAEWGKPWWTVVRDVVTVGDLVHMWWGAMGLSSKTRVFFVGDLENECKKPLVRLCEQVRDIKCADIVMTSKNQEPLSQEAQGYLDYMLQNDIPALPLTPQVRVIRDGRSQTVPEPFITTFCAQGGRVFSLMSPEEALLSFGLKEGQALCLEDVLVVTDEVVRVNAAKRFNLSVVLLESGSYKRGDNLESQPDYFSEGFFQEASALCAG